MRLRRLLLAYAFANAILYSMLLPLWEGFDEPFHFGYVQTLANGSGLPDWRFSLLSEEAAASILLAPGSLSVKRNIPEITSYPDFFAMPEAARRTVRQQLNGIDPALRSQPSRFVNYEGQQAPLAYAALAVPERALARVPLPGRVLALRMIAGALGALLLLFGTDRLAMQLGVPDPYRSIAIFCALSIQMTWATLAHVANDWLAVPLTVWLLVATIHYFERPGLRRAALASIVLTLGLLTKAYFLAFVPLVAGAYAVRRRWRDLSAAAAIVLSLAGPWYVRNVHRYGTVAGIQEPKGGVDPAAALGAIRIQTWPGAIESYARSALWVGNNTFRAYSVTTLRVILAVWLAGLLLWAMNRRRSAEWVVVLHVAVFALALAYDCAFNYVYSRGEVAGPAPWYTQPLLAPMLVLALLGASRAGKAGRAIAGAMVLLFGYLLVSTYWVKLIPLYAGFQGRTPLAAVVDLYARRFSAVTAGLNDACLAPAAVILLTSALVTLLTAAQQAVLLRRLSGGARSLAKGTGLQGRTGKPIS